MAEHCSDETEVTMCDVLEEERELEDDANAVLGGSDDSNCSYDQGYIPRQALYACVTCNSSGNAGICLACCYACHDGHEVVELYTKRNFRCDCGNSKFTGKDCSLCPNKAAVNEDNQYNHNFKGLYCSCERPYPDPHDDVPDEMIQCVICEDWYHGRHLGTKVPADYFEMTCGNCMANHKFLYHYLNGHHVDVTSPSSLKQDPSSIPTDDDKNLVVTAVQHEPINCAGIKQELSEDVSNVKHELMNKADVKHEVSENKYIVKNELNSGLGPAANDGSICILKTLDSTPRVTSGAAFWPENWRQELCRCATCSKMYENENVEFLLDSNDTVHAYEERGKGNAKENQYESGLNALSRLDRVKQMEAVQAYTSMKLDLKEYLKAFAENGKTVRESDIKEFFEQMSKKKRMNNGVPYFCR